MELLRLVLNPFEFMRCFSCHEQAVISASAVQPLHYRITDHVALQLWEEALSLLFLRSSVTSRATVSITKF